MSDRPLAAIVLAAGQGKRMKASVPKVLVEACGRTLVEHVLEALRPLGASPAVIVYGHGGAQVRQALSERDVVFAHQPEQLGTGHAVQCALPSLGEFCGDVVVLCGDTPLLTTEVLQELVSDHRENGRALTVLSAELLDPGSLGRVLRDESGVMTAIREAADATEEERSISEINTGVMVIESGLLAGALARLEPDNAQGEFYLTDVPRLLLDEGESVGACMTRDEGAALGVNNPLELAKAVASLRRRYRERLALDGVRIEDPESTVLDAGVEVGIGTVLGPQTYLGRGVRIGKECRIGPQARLHEGVVVGDGCELGAGVEIRRGVVEDGVCVCGPARLVDVALGRGARIGPGTVTADRGGGRVVIGEGAQIGAGSVLEAPLTIGERARVEPGTVLVRGARVPGGDDA